MLLRFSKDDDRNINRPDNKERHLQPTPVDIKRRASGRQHRRRRRSSGSERLGRSDCEQSRASEPPRHRRRAADEIHLVLENLSKRQAHLGHPEILVRVLSLGLAASTGQFRPKR